jgi:hypothetical protein
MIVCVPEITFVCQVECGAARFGTFQKKSDGTAIPQTARKTPRQGASVVGVSYSEKGSTKNNFLV